MTDRAERRRRERPRSVAGSKTGTRFVFDPDHEISRKIAAGGFASRDLMADQVWLANSLDHLFTEFNKLPPASSIDVMMLGANFYKALVLAVIDEQPPGHADVMWKTAVDTFGWMADHRGGPPQ